MGLLHRWTHKALAVTLAAVWVATLACADTAVTPAMHCRRPMPCCPQSRSSDNCTSAQCTDQVPEKTETRVVKASEIEGQTAAAAIAEELSPRRAAAPVRELTPGLCYHASVFRLKDDLRI